MKLKTLLISSTALSALCIAPATAQPIFDWTGFYIGGNIGGVWGRSTVSDEPGTIDLVAGPGQTNSPSSVIGGFQTGYNWQAGNLVYGVEGDIAFASASQSVAVLPFVGYSHTSSLSGLATLRGRVGIAFSPTLLYITGGAALGWLTHEQANAGVPNTVGRSSPAWGWTIGGGIEHAFARNWSVKAEYLYTQFTDAIVADNFGYVFRFKDAYSAARVGINYRF